MNLLSSFFKKDKHKKIIGRVERVNISNLGLTQVEAKIDTGAYRGTIHAENIQEVIDNNKKFLEFTVLDESHPEFHSAIHRTTKFKKAKVRSSQTPFEDRYIIPVILEIAGTQIKTELSLSDRKELTYPILIGRKALKNKFLVDVSREFLN